MRLWAGVQSATGPRSSSRDPPGRITLLLAAYVVAACTSSEPRPQPAPAAAPSRPGITVLRSKKFWFDWNTRLEPADAKLEQSIEAAIRAGLPDLRYIPREQLCRAVFPNLAPEAAPLALKSMRTLLESAEFRRRLDALKLRYIVYVSGRTEIEAEHHWIWVIAYPYQGYAGTSKWDKETVLSAIVFDLRDPATTQRATQTEQGTSWVAGVFPIALGPSADTEGEACEQLARQLVKTLAAAREKEATQ